MNKNKMAIAWAIIGLLFVTFAIHQIAYADHAEFCVKPFRITSNDPNFLDDQFDEIYLRMCEILRAHGDTTTGLIDSTQRCDVYHDTIHDCGITDKIFLETHDVELRDEDFASDVNSPSFRWFEHGNSGTNYAAFRAPFQLDSSYRLTLPVDAGKAQDELLVDDTGGLWWYDRNVFFGSSVDNTVYLDTLHDDSTDGNSIYLDAREIHLINTSSGAGVNDAKMPRLIFHNLEAEATDLSVTLRLSGDHTSANNAEDIIWQLPTQGVNIGAGHYLMEFTSSGGIMSSEFVHVGGAGTNKVEYGQKLAPIGSTSKTVDLEFSYINNVHLTIMVQWTDDELSPIWIENSGGQIIGVTADPDDTDQFTVHYPLDIDSSGNRRFFYQVAGTGFNIENDGIN